MKMRTCLAPFAVYMLATSFAQAQFSTPPPPELKQLDFLLGTYTGTAKTTMGDMKIKMTTAPAEGGMFLRSVNEFEVGPIKFTETMYIAWNAKEKKFQAWGFQSMVPTPREEFGEFKDNNLIFISKPWDMGGTVYISRSTMTITKPGEVKFLLEFKIGEEWSKQGDAILTKSNS